MTSFNMLSDFARAVFALWGLLLCLLSIGSAVLSAVRKRYAFIALALVILIPCYFMWQVIFDFSLFGGSENTSDLTLLMCGFSWVYWIAAFVVFTTAAVFLLAYNIHSDKTSVTPRTIKFYLDRVPCGICCFRESGMILFSNICMNNLCIDITGGRLLNGNQFREALADDILNVNGKVWRFSCNEIGLNGERLRELIATDITAEYAKTETLEKDKERLSRLNSELKDYYLSIDDAVRRQEILQAKMNIHDEMNRLMLSTVAADKDDIRSLDRIFSLWERNALLLCMESDKKTVKYNTDSLNSLSGALGIKLVWRGEMPEELDDNQRELLFITAQEAVINAVKHGKSKKMEISFQKTSEVVSCRFTNDGKMPTGEVRFEGGLANIGRLAEKQNASLYTEIGERFTLILEFKNHSIG